jgi:hypothetical protein
MNFNIGEQYFESRQYDFAFDIFRKIANDETADKVLRANSFNLMGVIISGFAPHLDKEDESGLKYFKKAIELDPDHIGALLNIVDTFGKLPSMHSDHLAFHLAYKKLVKDLMHQITANDRERLRRKADELGLASLS